MMKWQITEPKGAWILFRVFFLFLPPRLFPLYLLSCSLNASLFMQCPIYPPIQVPTSPYLPPLKLQSYTSQTSASKPLTTAQPKSTEKDFCLFPLLEGPGFHAPSWWDLARSSFEGYACPLKRPFINNSFLFSGPPTKQLVLFLRNCWSLLFKDKLQRMSCGFLKRPFLRSLAQSRIHRALKWRATSEALVVWHLLRHWLVFLFPRSIPDLGTTAISSPPVLAVPGS